MHYSPQDLQLGAQVQAAVDLEANGKRIGFSYGQPPQQDRTGQYIAGGLLLLGLFYVLRRK